MASVMAAARGQARNGMSLLLRFPRSGHWK